jgi:hypothetical protein
MFDDLDDDDVTDLIPDDETEKKEKERRREQEQRGRRMTVSEVCKIKKCAILNCFSLILKDSDINLSVTILKV